MDVLLKTQGLTSPTKGWQALLNNWL